MKTLGRFIAFVGYFSATTKNTRKRRGLPLAGVLFPFNCSVFSYFTYFAVIFPAITAVLTDTR